MVRNTNQITEHKKCSKLWIFQKTQIATDNASVGLPSESVRKMNNSGVFLTCFIINRIKLNKWSLIGFIFLAITIHFSHFEMEWLYHHADCIHYLVFVSLFVSITLTIIVDAFVIFFFSLRIEFMMMKIVSFSNYNAKCDAMSDTQYSNISVYW